MNKKSTLLLLLLAALCDVANAAGQSPPRLTVAVYNFVGDQGGTKYWSKVTALVTADLTTETNLIMVERAEVDKALKEQAFGVSGMVSSDAAAKVGAITGANVLVAGQVIEIKPGHLVIIANIIGTETARLFAVKVEGSAETMLDMTSELSRKIADTIQEHAASFVTEDKSHATYLDRIVKSVTGTNRPTVSVNIHWPRRAADVCISANTEMGIILQKAGFTVVDKNSERKPDIEIFGTVETDAGPRRGGLASTHAAIDLEVRERRTGKILAFDHQSAIAVDLGQAGARKAACADAADGLAERILPLLAK